MQNRKGFTLIELMVVVFITGLVAAAVWPGFQQAVARYRLYTAAREMVAQVREIQHLALSRENYNYRVKFYPDPGRNNEPDRYYIMENERVLKTVLLPPSVNLYNTNFDSDNLDINIAGNPVNGFGGTVQLENTWDRLYVIVAKTGRVRLSDRPPENWY